MANVAYKVFELDRPETEVICGTLRRMRVEVQRLSGDFNNRLVPLTFGDRRFEYRLADGRVIVAQAVDLLR